MQELGATAVAPIGLGNVKTDLIGPFDEWEEVVVSNIAGTETTSHKGQSAGLIVTINRGATCTSALDGVDLGIGTVLENKLLVDSKIGLAKKHLCIRLPPGSAYQAGDYLAVQPRNNDGAVSRVLRYFGYDDQTSFSVEGSQKKHLPCTSMSVVGFLKDRVELGTPVTKKQLAAISMYAEDENGRATFNDPEMVSFH